MREAFFTPRTEDEKPGMAKTGRIPSFRVGTCVRFDPRKVADWLKKV
jgi:hypothetical protein